MATAFEKLTTDLDQPLFIVTTAVDGERTGCLIGFATQCSIHPPRFLIGLSEKNHTWRVGRDAPAFAVHVVGKDDEALAELFGGTTGDEIDKFERCAWHDGPEGMPILDDVDAWFVGRALERITFGDHTGIVLEPIVAMVDGSVDNLPLSDAMGIDAGHDP